MRLVDAMPNSDGNKGAHEIQLELVNALGFKQDKEDEWTIFNILFASKQARDAFVLGVGYSAVYKSKVITTTSTQEKQVEEQTVTIQNHEIRLCVCNESDIETTQLFVDKGLRGGKSRWPRLGADVQYIPIVSKLDPGNEEYKKLVQRMAKVQPSDTLNTFFLLVENTEYLIVMNRAPKGHRQGGQHAAPGRRGQHLCGARRMHGCSGFGDLPGLG